MEIVDVPTNEELTIDSIYCRDASILTDAGAILCHMGKKDRRGEQATLEQAYKQCGIPILGKIEAPGFIEGGDTAWICLLYTSPSPRDLSTSRMPSSA